MASASADEGVTAAAPAAMTEDAEDGAAAAGPAAITEDGAASAAAAPAASEVVGNGERQVAVCGGLWAGSGDAAHFGDRARGGVGIKL